jgi:oligopeptide/dipeptide ABC transporter ATP-binding protein
MPLLDVRDLKTYFKTDDGIVHAVDGVSFTVDKGETLAIVGESGSGKSVTCMTIMGLNPKRNTLTEGQAVFKDVDLLTLDREAIRRIRGNEISMIFQDPMTSLNPVYTIGAQLREAVQLHENVGKDVANRRALEMLKAVSIPRAETRLDDYPHQFSGGMRQRVMIAMALINNPDLLIADEPTTALDVTTQAQILKLMDRLQRDFGSAIILVTHDLGVVAETADNVLVMYAAMPAETGTYQDIFYHPEHPYTWGLLQSLPRLAGEDGELKPIPGTPPSLLHPPSGCRFHLRCPYAFSRCVPEVPELLPAADSADSHEVACHLDHDFRTRESHDLLHDLMVEQA